jgi:hypothetical protein
VCAEIELNLAFACHRVSEVLGPGTPEGGASGALEW